MLPLHTKMMTTPADAVNALPASSDSPLTSVLSARAKFYGDFRDQGRITQEMKRILRSSPSWHSMDGHMQEAAEMIVHKLARIVNGNPFYMDSWVDIAGYATLVVDRLPTDEEIDGHT